MLTSPYEDFLPEPQALSWLSFCSFWTLPSVMFSQGFGNLRIGPTKSGKISYNAFPVTSEWKYPCSPSSLVEVVQRIGVEEWHIHSSFSAFSLGPCLWEAHTLHSFTTLSSEFPYEGKGEMYWQPWMPTVPDIISFWHFAQDLPHCCR